ncbi:MAG TPA: heparan-alpha-glucosaminide N-acetyltransferase domain-containing protein, partial [Cytophagaceae bacterium]
MKLEDNIIHSQSRIIGFDLARAYAIFGMYIVNFNFSFGSIMAPTEPIGRFLNIFAGNSTAIFIICAGIGLSFMTNRDDYTAQEKANLKSRILKRSWFLFALGLLLYNWWPGDILHFYGGYMHFAAFLLFVPRRYYIVGAISAILVFHLLLLVIPINTSWDFTTYKYLDFWTPVGFLRNTFYNGWNSMFPWLSFFLTGTWLGRLDWKSKSLKKNLFIVGLIIFIAFQFLRLLVKKGYFSPFW